MTLVKLSPFYELQDHCHDSNHSPSLGFLNTRKTMAAGYTTHCTGTHLRNVFVELLYLKNLWQSFKMCESPKRSVITTLCHKHIKHQSDPSTSADK